MLLEEDTECSHSWQVMSLSRLAEGAIGIAESKQSTSETSACYPEQSWKDAAQIIARINGFTFVETECVTIQEN